MDDPPTVTYFFVEESLCYRLEFSLVIGAYFDRRKSLLTNENNNVFQVHGTGSW